MPAHNLIPILFPKPKKDNIYDMLKKLSDIKEREVAIEQGGDINAETYQTFADDWDKISNDPNLSSDKRLNAKKIARDYELKSIKAALTQVKDLDEKGMDWMLTQDLRNVEFSLPENPYAFAQEAQIQIKRFLEGEGDEDGLNQRIETLREYGDERGVRKLEEYRDKLEFEELDKYARIQTGFEEKDYDLLSRYAIVYSPFYKGKTKNVRIVELSSTSPKERTNLKFLIDEDDNPITSAEQGMTMCFDGIIPSSGEKVNFAGIEFDYLGEMGFTTSNPESFDYQRIKHSTVGDAKAGMFVEDSHNKLFYVNKDLTYSPIKREEWKEELGFSEDKVYKLSPREELNTLPGAISSLPMPILERYNREAEMSDFNYWEAFKEELEPTVRKRVPEFLGKIEAGIGRKLRETPSRFLDITREGLKKGVEDIGKPRGAKPEPSGWELEEVGKSPTFEKAKEFIKKITPKY